MGLTLILGETGRT